MKFLVDVNLPPKLCSWLNDRHHEAAHLSRVESLRTPDAKVWNLATDRGEVIVSKDTDFYKLSLRHGPQPMIRAAPRMLDQLGVPAGQVAFDEF